VGRRASNKTCKLSIERDREALHGHTAILLQSRTCENQFAGPPRPALHKQPSQPWAGKYLPEIARFGRSGEGAWERCRARWVPRSHVLH
jgi:hypothetical protein